MKTAAGFRIGMLVLMVFAMSSCGGPSRVLVVSNTAGEALEIELLALKGEVVELKRMQDGKIFTSDMARFDATSQRAIRQLWRDLQSRGSRHPKLKIEEVVGRELTYLPWKKSLGEGGARTKRLRHERLNVAFSVKNESSDRSVEEAEFHFVFFGKSPFDENDYKILAKEVQLHRLPAAQTVKIECKPFVTSYDTTQMDSMFANHKYEGYFAIVRDRRSSEVVMATSSAAKIAQRLSDDPSSIRAVLKLPVGTRVTKELKPRKAQR